MATMINKINDEELEKEILEAMNVYANSVKSLIPFGKQNPLGMNEKRMRAYVKAQQTVTNATFEIEELARMYPSTFRNVAKTFTVK